MTPEEIRSLVDNHLDGIKKRTALPGATIEKIEAMHTPIQIVLLGEIAAQFAEHNELMREEQKRTEELFNNKPLRK